MRGPDVSGRFRVRVDDGPLAHAQNFFAMREIEDAEQALWIVLLLT
jgi:hypothetical protein